MATGSSPVGIYENLVKKNKAGLLDFSKVVSVNLDEYLGLDGDHEQSYRYFMNDNLFNHVNIDKANTYVPNGKAEDIELNVCKTKHLTNTRSSSADEALKLTPPKILSLEQALEFIDKDELLEITPKNIRIRKKTLDARLRKRENMNR